MRLTDEQIGAELRALRRTPDSGFAGTLDGRVTAGFPTPNRRTRDRELAWKMLAPVLAGIAAIAVIAVVISTSNKGELAGGGGAADLAAPSKSAPGSAASHSASGQASSTSQQALPAQPPLQPAPPVSRPHNGRPQIQELSASLGLSTGAAQIQRAADGVVDVANRYDGFVDSSDIRVGGTDPHASFTLRIPATHLRDALDDISALGRVTAREESSANATGAYVDAGRSFHDARAKVDSLLGQLRKASSPGQAAAIREQLVTARQELAAARSALRGVKGRVAYAPVSVQIRADEDGSWSIGDAADDAVGVLEAIAGATLITLAVLLPLAALLMLGWLGVRQFSRRRREATLDRS